jgi:hypothetical protein
MQAQEKYHDVTFFLIEIAFISAFNYYLTYTNISFNWFLVLSYLNDTIQGWLAWWAVRSIVIYLDKKLPYDNQVVKRILIQFFLTTITGLFIIILLTELTSWLVKGKAAPLEFYLFDVFIISIWFFVINGIYIGMHFYAQWNQSEAERQQEKKVRVQGFNVKQGKSNLLIKLDDILVFYTEDRYTVMLTWQNKKYFPDKSLEKVEEALPPEQFFRLNRQYIINRKAIKGFKRTDDGKIDVLIDAFDSLPASIPVSRTRAVSFKEWFQPNES